MKKLFITAALIAATTLPATSASALSLSFCKVYSDYVISVGKARDLGVPIVDIYELGIEHGMTDEFMMGVLKIVFISGEGVSPKELGKTTLDVCIDNVRESKI